MGLLRQLIRSRFVRFGGIGLACLIVVQMPILWVLSHLGMAAVLANACGFLLSTFVNFVLQRAFTFGDCSHEGWRSLGKFVMASVVALGVNTGMFAVLHGGLGAWVLMASAAGAVVGSGVNFAINRFLTFQQEKEVPVATKTEARPSLEAVRAAVRGNTLAVFMPAYNEAENLPAVVGGLHAYLTSLELLDCRIIIVDDGSPDNTQEVVRGLRARFAEVELRTHLVNQGYGGALRTGFRSVIGNLFFSYQKLATPLARGEYGLGKWLLLTPFWWMFTSLSGYKALYELIIPSKRSAWAKTEHGHDQARVPGEAEQSQIAAATLPLGTVTPGTQPVSQPTTPQQ